MHDWYSNEAEADQFIKYLLNLIKKSLGQNLSRNGISRFSRNVGLDLDGLVKKKYFSLGHSMQPMYLFCKVIDNFYDRVGDLFGHSHTDQVFDYFIKATAAYLQKDDQATKSAALFAFQAVDKEKRVVMFSHLNGVLENRKMMGKAPSNRLNVLKKEMESLNSNYAYSHADILALEELESLVEKHPDLFKS